MLSIILFSVGGHLYAETGKIIEVSQRYDNIETCSKIKKDDFTTTCSVDITIDAAIAGPVYVYYELKNYYQNHRTYVKSRDTGQLRGEYEDMSALTKEEVESKLIDCEPVMTVGDLYDY